MLRPNPARARRAASVPSPVARALVALALPLALAACRSRPVELRLDFAEGQTWSSALALDQEVRQEIEGHELTSTQRVFLGWQEEVVAVRRDGSATLRLTWDAARLELDGPELGSVSYDSTRSGEPVSPFALGLDALMGESVRLEVSRDGAVVAQDDLAGFADRIATKLALPPGPEGDIARAAVRRHFGPDVLAQLVSALTDVHPGRPVELGERWTRAARVDRGFPLEQENEYRLVALDEETATLALRSKLRTPDDAKPLVSGQARLVFDLEGSQKGRLVLDRRTGRVVLAEILQSLVGELAIEVPGNERVRAEVEVKGRIELAVQ